MGIWVNGVANGSVASCTLADVDTYTVFTTQRVLTRSYFRGNCGRSV